MAERNGIGLEFHHVQQILEMLAHEPSRAEKRVELPGDYDAVILERELKFEQRCPKSKDRAYEFPLSVPGEVEVPAAGLVIAAHLLDGGEGDLLDPDRAGSLHIRQWRPGDRFQPAHTREAKKVKELLQARHVPANVRARWPVVVGAAEGKERIVWVPGFSYPEQLLVTKKSSAGLRLEYRVRKGRA